MHEENPCHNPSKTEVTDRVWYVLRTVQSSRTKVSSYKAALFIYLQRISYILDVLVYISHYPFIHRSNENNLQIHLLKLR